MARRLEAKPKYVVSSSRRDFPWSNTFRLEGDLHEAVRQLKEKTPQGVLVGSPTLSAALERLGPTAMRGFDAAIFVAGATSFAWMVRTMKKARTPIHNRKTPTALVETGPFALTRNPMYLFGSLAYAGLSLLLVKPWSLALLPVVLAVTHHGVLRREEEFLDRHFGDAYVRYKARVRRWL